MEGEEAKLYLQSGHSGGINSVAFSPDGRWAEPRSHIGWCWMHAPPEVPANRSDGLLDPASDAFIEQGHVF
jgi:hypothetical protein